MVLQFEFIKQKGTWHFVHPQSVPQKGSGNTKTEVYREGLHTLLDQVGQNAQQVTIYSSDEPLDGGDELELTHPGDDGAGGFYLLKSLYQQPYVLLIHFFDVRSFFGYLPPRLYIKPEVHARPS
jgi:hypothetical protein